MVCPICNKRKAKRPCPARAQSICSVCCGTEREVTIDCPSDCVYLAASREYDRSRLEIDWSKLPFAEVPFDRAAIVRLSPLMMHVDHAVCKYAAEHRAVVDSDVLAVLQSLAEAYRTQASGIIYEKPIDYAVQRDLYNELKREIQAFREDQTRQAGMTTVRDADVRDALIYLTQLCAAHQNGRPKGRLYLDTIRQQFPKEEFQKSASSIVLL